MEHETDQASVMPMSHPTDVDAGLEQEAPTKAMPLAATAPVSVKKRQSLPGTSVMCAPDVVALLLVCMCTTVTLSAPVCSDGLP